MRTDGSGLHHGATIVFVGRHVFLSYVRESADEIMRLARALERLGVEPWLDRTHLAPGTRWREAIREAIHSGALFVACFTRHSASREKSYMNEELTLAIDELRQRPTDRKWFIPVVLDGGQVPARSISAAETLRDLQWLDLSNDWEAGVRAIVRLATESMETGRDQEAISTVQSRHTDRATSIFLSYPSSGAVYASILRSHLVPEFRIVPVQLADVVNIRDEISARIAEADCFLAVWCRTAAATHDEISPWLPYEYGVAAALNKPTLVLVSRHLPKHVWQRIDRQVPIPMFDEPNFERDTVPLVLEYCRTHWKKAKP